MRRASLPSFLALSLLTACPFDPPPAQEGETDPTGSTGTLTTDGSTSVDPDSTTGTPPVETTDDPGVLTMIRLQPPNAVLEVDLGTPGSMEYTVLGTFEDGSEMDVTADVDTWIVSNDAVGSMNGNVLEVPAFDDSFFASTLVTASIGDLEAQAQLTVAAYRQSGAQQDFFFLLPFADPSGPQEKPLTFSTDVKALDVFVNMDTTGSMGGPIANLQSSLSGTVIPGIQAAVPDTQFGVGAFEDFPISPFGSNPCFTDMQPDQPFTLLQAITDVDADVQAAVQALAIGGSPIGCGNDYPESSIEGMYQIATGDGLMGPAPTMVAPNMDGVGGVAFRDGSLPVIVTITDAPSHDPGLPLCAGGQDYDNNPAVLAVAHTRADTTAALAAICARVVTVAVSNFDPLCSGYSDGLYFADATGATIPPQAWDLAPGGRPPGCAADQCCTGLAGSGVPADAAGQCPLVYRANFDGTGLDDGVVDGVSNLALYATIDVTTEVTGTDTDTDGLPLPPGTSTADFILSVTPLEHGPVPLPGAPTPTLTPDAFLDVTPNTEVTFTVEAFNSFLPQGSQPRLFVAQITVLADGCSDLDTRDVFILVPPADLDPVG